jgi:hypothetical protein
MTGVAVGCRGHASEEPILVGHVERAVESVRKVARMIWRRVKGVAAMMSIGMLLN